MIREVMPIVGERVKRLIVDRGFMSGGWITDLKTKHSLDTVVGLKSDMILHQDMIALSKDRDTKWIKVDSPKFHKREIPTRRICYLSELDLWEECKVPLSGIVIRDKYTDGIEYQTVVTTDLSASAKQIHEWIRSRWDIEETFMAESRYGCLNRIGSCRESLAAALVHFSLLAYTLLKLFARQEKAESRDLRPRILVGGVELVAYWRGYYAIIFPSELVELVARCAPSWGERLPSILEKLRTVERPP